MSIKIIDRFIGDYGFLSNFYTAPITMSGEVWPTVEHYFQALKTVNKEHREAIRMASTSERAKAMGSFEGTYLHSNSSVLFKIELRRNWETIKTDVMMRAVVAKFNQNSYLHTQLMLTKGAMLVEGNHWHDNTWGNCNCYKCSNIPGRNYLGKLLMWYRNSFTSDHIDLILNKLVWI
jgi:hypothetical protein